MIKNEPRPELAKTLNKWAYAISTIVLITVLLMRRVKFDLGIDFNWLPGIHAGLNSLTAGILILALYYIKAGRVEVHKRLMFAAMFLSFLFLISYVLYHFTTPETRYCNTGTIRIVYFVLLISHIIVAAVSFPFILFTFIRGYTLQVENHRKMARWVYPMWLYVALSGPICYWMLLPCYGN